MAEVTGRPWHLTSALDMAFLATLLLVPQPGFVQQHQKLTFFIGINGHKTRN